MQTRKRVIEAAIKFETPDRLPILFDRYGRGDVHGVNWNQTGTGDTKTSESFDEWGCGWRRSTVANMGQVKIHPLDDWLKLDSFNWPDPDSPSFYEGIEERFAPAGDRYVTTGIFMLLFERMQSLRGFENVMSDFYDEYEKISALADRIAEYDIRIIENIASRAAGRIDGFSFTDDWGSETALLTSPALWKQFFKPRYKKIFDACRNAGWDVWMHSCGKVNDIIEDLIEIGCGVINLQQPRLLGIEEIGKKFAGRICFQTTCDIQHTLPMENDEYIENEAVLLMDSWGTERGGFILSDYGDENAIGATPEKTRVMLDAFLRHDRWRISGDLNG